MRPGFCLASRALPPLEGSSMGVRLLIADDHELVRSGIRSLLTDQDIDVVGEAANGVEAVTLAKQLQPDIVLLDIRMSDGDGLSALEEMHAQLPNTKVVILSTYDNPTYMA